MERRTYRRDHDDEQQDGQKLPDGLVPIAPAEYFDEQNYRDAEVGAVLGGVALKIARARDRAACGAEQKRLSGHQESQQVGRIVARYPDGSVGKSEREQVVEVR